jgi:glycosyltransferase involved in cell wall biosynthesis
LNILFVLYGDLNSNTAIPITLFAKHLHVQGHQCAIAVPQRPDPAKAILNSFLPAFGFDQILEKNCAIFAQGERAHIVHACTPRMVVYEFICEYMNIIPTPIAIYLEDSEDWISHAALEATESSILSFANQEINERLPKHLSHPFDSLYFIGLCDLAILIQKKLAVTAPPFIPQKIVPWGYDLEEFQNRLEGIDRVREKYDIPTTAKVIVYPGGINLQTASSIKDLCEAVIQINQQGMHCILVRTGPGPLTEIYPNDDYPKNIIRDLGVISRSDIPSLLNIADVFVQPGRINRFEDLRLPSKIPEFLAMGKPLLLPNCHIADMFEDGIDAMILKTGEPQEIAAKCLEIFSDEELSARLGKKARLIALEHFDINKQTNLLVEAYQETIRSFESNYSLEKSKEIWAAAKSTGALNALCIRLEALTISSPNLYPHLMKFAIGVIQLDQTRIAALSQRIDVPLDEIKILKKDIEVLKSTMLIQSDDLSRAEETVLALEHSRSWRITSPLRWVSRILR